jgi:hypothetical protein
MIRGGRTIDAANEDEQFALFPECERRTTDRTHTERRYFCLRTPGNNSNACREAPGGSIASPEKRQQLSVEGNDAASRIYT